MIINLRTPGIINERELQKFLGVSRGSVRNWLLYPRQPLIRNFPEVRKRGRSFVWSAIEISEYFGMANRGDYKQIKTLYSVKELAIELGVSESTIRRLLYADKLKFFRIGTKLIRVTRDSLEKYLDECQKEKIRKLREGMVSGSE